MEQRNSVHLTDKPIVIPGEEVGELAIEDLIVTQAGIRDFNKQSLQFMIDFVSKGGIFDMENLKQYANANGLSASTLINIGKFEDMIPKNRIFVWDGHHRVLAIWLGGREYLHPKEFQLTKFRFELTASPSFSQGFVTPFDPRTEVRLPEFYSFKKEVVSLIKNGEKSKEEILDYIYKSKDRYKTKKDVQHCC